MRSHKMFVQKNGFKLKKVQIMKSEGLERYRS